MNIETRLAKLELVYRRPEPPRGDRYDFRNLTPQEQYELDGLLSLDHPVNDVEAALGPRTPDQEARLTELWSRVVVR